MRATATAAAATTFSANAPGSPATVNTERWWSGSADAWMSPGPKAAPMASRVARSRPSEKLGTASTVPHGKRYAPTTTVRRIRSRMRSATDGVRL